MTRKEFVKHYRVMRAKKCKEMVAKGEMRASEAAMTMAGADKEAGRFWRRNRASLAGRTIKEIFSNET